MMLCPLCDGEILPNDAVQSFGFEIVHSGCADSFHGRDEPVQGPRRVPE